MTTEPGAVLTCQGCLEVSVPTKDEQDARRVARLDGWTFVGRWLCPLCRLTLVSPAECDHVDFVAEADVCRSTDVEDGPVVGYHADIRVTCIACGTPAIWHCPDFGLQPDRPALSVDGQELRAPLRMASQPEDFGLQLPGLTISAHVHERPSPN